MTELNLQLMDAIYTDNAEKVKELLKEGADPLVRVNGTIPLFYLVEFKATWDLVEDIIDMYPASIGFKDMNGRGLLSALLNRYQHAIQNFNQIEKLIYLVIDKGANVNPKNDTYNSPLTSAILSHVSGAEEIVKLLLEKGALVNPEGVNIGMTPLTAAISRDNVALFDELIGRGAEISPKNTNYTPLIAAIDSSNLEWLKKLDKLGVDFNSGNQFNSPLTQALNTLAWDKLEYILNKGSVISDQQILNSLFQIFNNYSYLYIQKESQKITSAIFNEVLKRGLDINAPVSIGGGIKQYLFESVIFSLQFNKFKELFDKFAVKINNTQLEGIFKKALGGFHPNLMYMLESYFERLSNDPEGLLIAKIKLDPIQAKELLLKAPKISSDKLLLAIADSYEDNIDFVQFLREHEYEIDWNKPIDKDNNNLLLLKAQSLHQNFVTQALNLKDVKGLPLFKVNHVNEQGLTLMEFYSHQLSVQQQMNALKMIHTLREHGAKEPKNALVPNNIKLNVIDTHHNNNEAVIDKLQMELKSKFLLDNDAISNLYSDMNSYLEKNKELLTQSLTLENYQAILLKLNQVTSDDNTYMDHNRCFSLRENFAYIWLKAKELSLEEGFCKILSELNGCPWGQLVNMYKLIENQEAEDSKPVINFEDLANEAKANDLVDQLVKEVYQDLYNQNEIVQNVLFKFYQDVSNYYDNFENFSIEGEYVLSKLHQILVSLSEKNGKSKQDIYTLDAIEFYKIIKFAVSNYKYSDTYDENDFYQVVHYSEEGKVFEYTLKGNEINLLPNSIEKSTYGLTSIFDSNHDLINFVIDEAIDNLPNKEEFKSNALKILKEIQNCGEVKDLSVEYKPMLEHFHNAFTQFFNVQGFEPNVIINYTLNDTLNILKIIAQEYVPTGECSQNAFFSMLNDLLTPVIPNDQVTQTMFNDKEVENKSNITGIKFEKTPELKILKTCPEIMNALFEEFDMAINANLFNNADLNQAIANFFFEIKNNSVALSTSSMEITDIFNKKLEEVLINQGFAGFDSSINDFARDILAYAVSKYNSDDVNANIFYSRLYYGLKIIPENQEIDVINLSSLFE